MSVVTRSSTAFERRAGLSWRRTNISHAVVVVFCVLSTATWAQAQPRTIVVPANVEWFDTGIDVRASTIFFLEIKPTGNWTNTAGGQLVGAAGYGTLRLPNAVAPTEPFASLIGRVNGTIFGIGASFRKKSPASGRLFLAMNDVPGTFGDNSGELTVVIDQPVNRGPITIDDPVVFLDLLSLDPQPFFERPSFRWIVRNKTRPTFSSQLVVFLDGLQSAADPPPSIILDLAANSERSGTFSLFTGVDPVLPAGDHTVKIELWALTPDHKVLATATSSVTSFVPSPPPSIAITEFKSAPDFQDQGKDVELSWTLLPTTYCLPADLVLKKKDYGEPEIMVVQEASPSVTGARKETIKGTSSPLTYTLSVSCKFSPAGQKLAGTLVTRDVKVGFGITPPPATPNVLWNGAFFTPSTVRAKQSFSVSWTFWNAGGAKSAEFDVQLYLDGVKEGDAQTVPAFDPGKSKNLEWTIAKELTSGPHTIELKSVSNGSSLDYRPFTVVP
jgi:hypothetical protein